MAKMFFARCKIKASFVFHSLMNIFEISNTPTRRCYINHNKDYSVVKTFKVERKLRLECVHIKINPLIIKGLIQIRLYLFYFASFSISSSTR